VVIFFLYIFWLIFLYFMKKMGKNNETGKKIIMNHVFRFLQRKKLFISSRVPTKIMHPVFRICGFVPVSVRRFFELAGSRTFP
jgi:hypothetical protein